MPTTERRRRQAKLQSTKHLKEESPPVRAPTTSARKEFLERTFTAVKIAIIFCVVFYFYNDTTSSPSASGFEVQNEMFKVIDIPGKGKGVIALRDIEQGELVIREEPLFVVPHEVNSSPSALIMAALESSSGAGRNAFFNLSYVNLPKHLDPKKNRAEVALAIFQTNAVAAGENVGIFPGMARLNHGCSAAFNVVYNWREAEKALFVRAVKNIRKGEELLTTYTDTKRPREQRRAFLSEHYGFLCTCSVCSLDKEQSHASDQRLSEISELYTRFATWGNGKISGTDAIAIARRIWVLEEAEGYWSERGRLAADATWVAAAHSDLIGTRAWARTAIEWYTYEIGGDSEQVKEMEAILTLPESHRVWGSREHLNVGGLDP